ncbi:MAG: sulfatase-like hydrolase/transferase, partial [Roseovarius sp.]|nr:sulfatase-like hydrolase/transferase [Roseovarius sp.]
RSSVEYPETWFGPYMGFEHVEMMLVGHNWFLPEKPPAGQHYEHWFYADGHGDEKNRLYRENAGDTRGAAQTWHSRLPVAWHNSTWTADRAINWLKEQSVGKKPFCAWISFPDPHHPFDAPEPWSRLHDPDEIDLPQHRERTFGGRPWWHEQVLTAEPAGPKKNAETRKAYSRISQQSDDQLREIIANTYGQIALVDHQLGRIMISLREFGLSENTVVVYASDHGDWLGDHGLILKGPMHYEGLLRVPLVFWGAGIESGQVNENPVSTLDLGATFAEYAGISPLLPQHGQSLLPLLRNSDEKRKFALNEWELLPTRAGVALSLRTVRTGTAKMTVDQISGAGELYDLAADPCELVNQYDNPRFRPLRDELQSMLYMRPDDCIPHQTQVGMA